MTDTLSSGGLERVAVNLGNLLPRDRYDSYLCVTRHEGQLSACVSEDVTQLVLNRKGRFDTGAIRALVRFIGAHEIGILHAHGTSLFIAVAASLFPPYPTVIWHDHFGAYRIATRPGWVYKLALRRVAGVIVVNPLLAEWSRRLGVATERVWYVPNCTSDVGARSGDPVELPGRRGARVVCVAKFRPQKDHLTLIRAWALVIRRRPHAHLILVGSGTDTEYLAAVHKEVERRGLGAHVTFLGERSDVSAILRQCDIGVLSSASEGFPLALLEYGMARLGTVATNVGQCAEVLDHGAAGLLAEPGDPGPLCAAISELLDNTARRSALGGSLYRRVNDNYGIDSVMRRICAVYDTCHSSTNGR